MCAQFSHLRYVIHAVRHRALSPWVDDVALEHGPLHEHAVLQHGAVQHALDLGVDGHGGLQRVAACRQGWRGGRRGGGEGQEAGGGGPLRTFKDCRVKREDLTACLQMLGFRV